MDNVVDGEITIRQDGWSGPWRLGDGFCGHCNRSVAFKETDPGGSSWSFRSVTPDREQGEEWLEEHRFIIGLCPRPTCARATVVHEILSALVDSGMDPSLDKREVIYPLASGRPQLPPEVPAGLRARFVEAARIESLSPNGAAFLGRRLLEQVLRTALGEQGQLAGLIDKFLEKNALPGNLAELMHDVRQFGNIAAHPAPASDGEWIEVDQEEATYVLDVVSELLDHVYVRPRRQAAMRERWEAKRRGEAPNTSPLSRVEVEPAETSPERRGSPFEEDDDLPF